MSNFKKIVEEHKAQSALLREERRIAEKEAVKALEVAAEYALRRSNAGAEVVYSRQWRIESRLKELKTKNEKIENLSKKWQTVYDQFNDSLKELGNVKDWSRAIENELDEIIQSFNGQN